MPQIIQITSEAIQAQIRRLLPSQQGFSIDMEASSVITPVIDITPAAEGSQLPSYLQSAFAFGSNTGFAVVGSTTTNITVTPGFYTFRGVSTVRSSSSGSVSNKFLINDGSSSKDLWQHGANGGGINGEHISVQFDLSIYVRQTDFLQISADSGCNVRGSYRQTADVTGNLINPAGFTFE
jgi:hypothetical protein